MLKIRITFVDTNEGHEEKDKVIKKLNDEYVVINESKVYKGRNGSKYNNIYLDVEVRK